LSAWGGNLLRPKAIRLTGPRPLTLLEAALKRAEADSGGKLLARSASPTRHFLSWL